jgi:hypothetical protein
MRHVDPLLNKEREADKYKILNMVFDKFLFDQKSILKTPAVAIHHNYLDIGGSYYSDTPVTQATNYPSSKYIFK